MKTSNEIAARMLTGQAAGTYERGYRDGMMALLVALEFEIYAGGNLLAIIAALLKANES